MKIVNSCRVLRQGLLGLLLSATLCGHANAQLATANPALTKLLTQAEQHTTLAEYQASYVALAAAEIAYAGIPAYDFAFGNAALNIGEHGVAVFVLSRVVSSKPKYSHARYLYAKALVAYGDKQRALAQFHYILSQDPYDIHAVLAQQNINFIHAQNPRSISDVRIGMLAGYDSNANSSTTLDDYINSTDASVPRITIGQQNFKQSSALLGLHGSARAMQRFAEVGYVRLAGNLLSTHYPSARFVSHTEGYIRAGIGGKFKPVDIRVDAKAWRQNIDGSRNHVGVGSDIVTKWPMGKHTAWLFGAEYADIQYASQAKLRSVDQYLGHMGIEYRSLQHFMQLKIRGGREIAEAEVSPYSRRLYRISFDAAYWHKVRHRVGIKLAYQQANYDRDFEFLASVFGPNQLGRHDEQWQARAEYSYEYGLKRQWVVHSWVRYIDNQSTISLYDYDGTQVVVGLSYRM